MFYYLAAPLLSYNFILIAAAVIPAVILMVKVYRSDRLEPESPALLRRLAIAGVLSALLALLLERVLGWILQLTVASSSPLYGVLLYFVVVAASEEGAKYLLLRRRTWRSPEFNCQYDGVVYAVFVSLGFALWENISYVLHNGFGTALIRAVTAIPGHACFGVFMGVFYGMAKNAALHSRPGASRRWRIFAVAVPALLHGAYDYIATADGGTWYFIGFIAALFALSYALVGKTSGNDRYMN